MRKIQIAERLRPFSHTPGAACLIPGTCFVLQAFPTLLKIGKHEIPLALTGPVKNFTVQQDLEKDCVFVFGKAKEGYFKLRVSAYNAGFDIQAEKGPLKRQQIADEVPFFISPQIERLSLGSHKAQDWDRPKTLEEILPLIFMLGQKIPPIHPQPVCGTARLLEPSTLESLFQAGFTKILVPRLIDDQHQGLVPEERVEGDPCFLVQEGAKLIRALFFQQNQRRIKILPQVQFDAGRMIGIRAPGIGEFDIEWSKKCIRRVILRASASGDVIFEFRKEIKTYRINRKRRVSAGDPLLVEAGKTYDLDQFQR